MKTVYTAKVTFDILVDPARPETIAAAAAWMGDLVAGKIITPPEGLPLTIEVTSPPSMVGRRAKGEAA